MLPIIIFKSTTSLKRKIARKFPWFLKADNEGSRKPRRMVKQSTTLNGNELLFNTWKKSVVIVKPRVSGMKSAILKAPSMRGIRSWRFTGSDGEDYGGSRSRSYVSSSQSQQSIDSV